MFGVRHARTPPAEMITYTCISTSLLLSVARSAIIYITMPGFFLHPPQLIEVMQMHVYRHFQCSDFIHVDECVQNEKKNKSDGYKRQGEVHRVSGSCTKITTTQLCAKL